MDAEYLKMWQYKPCKHERAGLACNCGATRDTPAPEPSTHYSDALEEAAVIAEDEPELPGNPPKELWAAADNLGREEMLRITVRVTKENIARRIRALKPADRSPALCAEAPRGEAGEETCERCHQPNPLCWFVASDIWNRVMRGGDRGAADRFVFCCPTCFIELAREAGVDPTAWELVPEAPREAAPPTALDHSDFTCELGWDEPARAIPRLRWLAGECEVLAQDALNRANNDGGEVALDVGRREAERYRANQRAINEVLARLRAALCAARAE